MYSKAVFKQAFSDRSFVLVWLVCLLFFMAIIVLSSVEIRPSDLQLPIRYTVFGITNIYRAQWYTVLAFPAFATIVIVLHTFIAVRLYTLKNQDVAKAFLWLTAIVLAIAFLIFLAVFRVIAIVQ